MNSTHINVVGCGIIKKELEYLIKKNSWNISTKFACSSLHVDFNMLWNSLDKMLHDTVNDKEKTLVLYGTCHPLMKNLITQYNSSRIPVQNCIELLLGKDDFTKELKNGAFFLLEDWAKRWDYVTSKIFGEKITDEKMIFMESHTCLLALRTPTSGNFEKEAIAVSEKIGLPLVWRDINLDVMENYISKSIGELIDV